MSERGPEITREARVAGLRDFVTPTLEAVERRRWQLWMLAAFVMFALGAAIFLLSTQGSPLEVVTRFVPLYVLRVLFIGFIGIVALYLVDRESRLRSITRHLIDERVLSAALSNRLKEVSLLSEAGSAVTRVLDLDETLRLILDSALELLEAEEGSVMLIDPAGDQLVVAVARTTNQRVTEAVVPLGEGVAGWVASHREPILISGDAPAGFFEGLASKERPISSAVSVPLVSSGELRGVLNVNDFAGRRRFSEYDLRALQLFAEHAAAAIRNARAYEQERKAVAQLEEVDRMKTEFVATISHELRTPLTSIIGAAKTMRRRGKDLSDLQRSEFLEVVERQGQRLLRLIEEVLSAARIETGVARLKREPVEAVTLTREVVKAEESAGVTNPISLSAPTEVMVYADATALEQVLTNLIDNAVKYSPGESPISIRISDDVTDVRFEVTDRGRGISPSALPQIFERFRQADQSMTRQAGGVGLGLYIVKNLVAGLGGEIAVDSQEGRGSTFTVRLPKRRA